MDRWLHLTLKRRKQKVTRVFLNTGKQFLSFQQIFALWDFMASSWSTEVTSWEPDLVTCRDIKEKIALLGSSQLHIMLGDRGFVKMPHVKNAAAGIFPLWFQIFSISFQYLMIKRHGFTCIFNFLKLESCMSLKLALRSGFQSRYLRRKETLNLLVGGLQRECHVQKCAIFTCFCLVLCAVFMW